MISICHKNAKLAKTLSLSASVLDTSGNELNVAKLILSSGEVPALLIWEGISILVSPTEI